MAAFISALSTISALLSQIIKIFERTEEQKLEDARASNAALVQKIEDTGRPQ